MLIFYKVWIINNGGRVFGEGLYRLLKEIQLTGSLREAASGLGMAYSKAHRVISTCERNIGFTLTEKKVGGISGGGSEVTEAGIQLVETYERFCKKIEKGIKKSYMKHFGQFIEVKTCKSILRKKRFNK